MQDDHETKIVLCSGPVIKGNVGIVVVVAVGGVGGGGGGKMRTPGNQGFTCSREAEDLIV